jgi:hypothetical protein
VPERLNGAVSKTVDPSGVRGFESHPLRHSTRPSRGSGSSDESDMSDRWDGRARRAKRVRARDAGNYPTLQPIQAPVNHVD